MEQQIRFCTTSDGVRIAYATVGEGPPLVFVRGWVSHLEMDWQTPMARQHVEGLARRLRVIRFDKRGTGLSDRDITDYSVDARLRDLEAVVDDLKLRRFVLQGYSEGGPIAIAYAAKHPKRVSHLILVGTYVRGAALGRPEVRDALVGLVEAEWGLGSETLTNLFIPGASNEDHEDFTAYQRAGASRQGAAAALRAVYEVDVTDQLMHITAATLVVHARGDRVIPFEQGRELASRIRGARFLPVESDRHMQRDDLLASIHEAIIEFVSPAKREKRPSQGEPAAAAPLTILFTDMESSSALAQRLGDDKAQELRRTHNAVVREALKEHHGNEIKHTGDGIMASFASAASALQCAVAIQRRLAEQHDGTPLRVRVGLNAGEPIAEDRDLFGTSVDLAKRVCDTAEASQIVVADVVRQLAAGKGFLFADLGEVIPKGFEEPVRLYQVRWQAEDA